MVIYEREGKLDIKLKYRIKCQILRANLHIASGKILHAKWYSL